MPMYTYRCPMCETQVTRIVRRSEADKQRCDALVEHRPPNEESIIIICDTKLVRPEVELTARTPEAWRT